MNPEESFQNAIPGTLYGFDGTYVQLSYGQMVPGEGYWLNFYETETVTFECDDHYALEDSHVHDIIGNAYPTTQIGNQLWMAKNLRTTHYNNGDEIPSGDGDVGWFEHYDVYNWDESYAEEYGYYYSWYVVNNPAGLCPENWRVPSREDFQELSDYLGGGSVAGGKLKETGTEHWNSPNTGATNSSGFTALPTGYHGEGEGSQTHHAFHGFGGWAPLTTSSLYFDDPGGGTFVWYWQMTAGSTSFTEDDHGWPFIGYPVRCIYGGVQEYYDL